MTQYYCSRSALICAFFLAVVAMLGVSVPAAAQGLECQCDFITINVDKGVQCSVTVCALTLDGARNCTTIAPGTRGRLRCLRGAILYIRDCHNNLVPLNLGAICTRGIGAGPNCCTVDACFGPNDTLCTVLTITPSILDVCPCP